MLLVMLSGLLLSLSLCLDLGIVNTAIINRGIRDGAGAAFFIGLGSCFGDLVYATLSVLGMAVIFNYTPVRWLLWIGGGGVLLWLSFNMARSAWRDYRQHRGLAIDTAGEGSLQVSAPASRHFISGMGMALASPSALLWFAAVGGTLIAQATDGSARQIALFLGGFFYRRHTLDAVYGCLNQIRAWCVKRPIVVLLQCRLCRAVCSICGSGHHEWIPNVAGASGVNRPLKTRAIRPCFILPAREMAL